MAKNTGVGGLYATIGLDVSQATQQINKLGSTLRGALATATAAKFGGLTRLNATLANTNRNLGKTTNAANKAAKATDGLGRSAERTARSTSKLQGQMNKVSGALSSTFASFGAARSGNFFYGISSGLQAATKFMGSASAGGLRLSSVLTAIGVAAAAAAASFVGLVVGVRKLTSVSNQSAGNLERLMVSFEALLGTAAAAREELNFLIEAAKISPFFTEDIVALDRFLLAQGLLNDSLRRGVTQSLIDFGAAAGLTGDRLRDLGYALGQVYNAGRLTGDEARQLRNNFLGAEQVLRSLPRYANLTGLELKKAMEAGRISSQDFFEAFFVYTSRFGDAAAAQQQTLIGLKDTLIDVFVLGLGEANLALANSVRKALAPMESLKAIFRELLRIFEQIDFRPLVASLGAVFNAFAGPIANFLRNEASAVVDFFEDRLPRAIVFVANVFRALWVVGQGVFGGIAQAVKAVIGIFSGLFQTIFGGSKGSSTALTFIGRAALLASVPVLGFMAKWITLLGAVITLIRTIIALLTGGWEAAGKALQEGVLRIGAAVTPIVTNFVDAWVALGDLEAINFDDLVGGSGKVAEAVGGVGDLGGAFPPTGEGDGGAGAASKASEAADKAMDSIYDMLQRWFGLRSDLEDGFLGAEGFEATVASIASTGKKLVEALRQIPGAEAAVEQVIAATERLVELARRREEVADALKEAENSLNEAIKSRDDFAAKVRQTSLDFANAFSAEEETMRSFELASDRGFFYETEQTKQKSFIDSLRERYAAMKKFLADVRKLKELGLNAGLLEEIIAAGPEQAGEVAAALAEGGAAMVGEVNVLQAGVTQVADELAEFGANEFYQAGVDMAQSQVDGLTANLAAIERAALDLVQVVNDVVEPWAKQMVDTGAAAGAGLAAGLETGTSQFGELMGNFTDDTTNYLEDLETSFGDLPLSWGGAILDGEDSMTGAMASLFDGLLAEFETGGGDILVEWESLWDKFPKSWDDFEAEFTAKVDNALIRIANAFKAGLNFWNGLFFGFWNGVIGAFEYGINVFIQQINRIIQIWNDLPFTSGNVKPIGEVSLGRLDGDKYNFKETPLTFLPGSPYAEGGTSELLGPAPINVEVYIGDEPIANAVNAVVVGGAAGLVGGRRS